MLGQQFGKHRPVALEQRQQRTGQGVIYEQGKKLMRAVGEQQVLDEVVIFGDDDSLL